MIKREHELEEGEIEVELEVKPAAKNPRSTAKAKGQSSGGTKQRWTAEEDAILITLLEKIVKDHVWPVVKQDGRLVSRTSYGVQYHALMLLKQGTGVPKGSSRK